MADPRDLGVLQSLRAGRSGLDPLLRALSGLSRLRLCLLECTDAAVHDGYAPPLPGGPWLHSLEGLGAGIGTLLSSTAVLRAAARLEHVSIANSPAGQIDWRSPAAAAFFDWLAQHPPLRCFSVDVWREDTKQVFASTSFTVHIAQLGRRRPALLIQLPGLGGEGKTFDASLDAQYPF